LKSEKTAWKIKFEVKVGVENGKNEGERKPDSWEVQASFSS
jgi:hypothetical protein